MKKCVKCLRPLPLTTTYKLFHEKCPSFEVYIAILVTETLALIGEKCARRAGELIRVPLDAAKIVLENLDAERAPGAVVALQVYDDEDSATAFCFTGKDFKKEACNSMLKPLAKHQVICDFYHPNSVLERGDWILTDLDHARAATARLQQLPSDFIEPRFALNASSNLSTRLPTADADESLRSADPQATWNNLRKQVFDLARIAEGKNVAKLNGIVVRCVDCNQLGVIMVQSKNYPQVAFFQDVFLADNLVIEVGNFVEFHHSFLSLQETHYDIAFNIARQGTSSVLYRANPNTSLNSFELLWLQSLTHGVQEFSVVPESLSLPAVEKFLKRAIDQCKLLQAASSMSTLNVLTVEELISLIQSKEEFQKMKVSEWKQFSLQSLRDYDVSGSKLIENFSEVDINVLQDPRFSFKVRGIILSILEKCRFPLPDPTWTVISRAGFTKVKNIVYDPKVYLGTGRSGFVFSGFLEENDTSGSRHPVAIKKISRFADQVDTKVMVRNEMLALKSLSHPNILRLLDTVIVQSLNVDEELTFLVLEKCDVDLRSVLDNKFQKWPFPTLLYRVKYLVLPICEALKALHCFRLHPAENGIIHRDIKPENILLVYDTFSARWMPKLCDMGYSLRCKPPGDALSCTVSMIHKNQLGLGTAGYMCPTLEPPTDLSQIDTNFLNLFKRENDIFSLGCVIFEIVSTTPSVVGVHPYEDRTQVQHFMASFGKTASECRLLSVACNVQSAKNSNQPPPSLHVANVLDVGCPIPDRLALLVTTLVKEMVSPTISNRPTIEVICDALAKQPSMLTAAERYNIVDNAVKMVATALVPVVEELGNKLLHHIQAEYSQLCISSSRTRHSSCSATELHKLWVHPVTGLHVFPGLDKAQKENLELQKTRRARLSPVDHKKFQDLRNNDPHANFHDFAAAESIDTCGARCICVEFAELLIPYHNALQPDWGNSDFTKWHHSGWELVKLFVSPLGPRALSVSPNDVDTSSLLHSFRWFVKSDKSTTRNLAEQLLTASGGDFGAFLTLVEDTQSIRNNHIAHALRQDYDPVLMESHMATIINLLSHPCLTGIHPNPHELSVLCGSLWK